MLIDARKLNDGTELGCELAVIGAGPAGISIVDRLRGSGLSIALIESGGFVPELRSQLLYRGEVVGDPYFRLDACRYRLFGGSSTRWAGWCRPLDPIDFEARDWIPASGWPIRSTDLEPFHADAAKLLELPTSDFTVSRWSPRLSDPLPLANDDFDHAIFQFSPKTDFAERYGKRIVDAANVTTLIHANVTEMLLDSGTTRVGALQVRTLNGRSFTVRARAVVLAAGGIENARLLLASQDSRPAGLGNEHDLVGRYFMEHVHLRSGQIALTGELRSRGFYKEASHDGALTRALLTPAANALARRRLPGCTISLENFIATHSFMGRPARGWSPWVTTLPIGLYRRLRRSHRATADRLLAGAEMTWKAARAVRSGPSALKNRARYLADQSSGLRLLSLYFRGEQVPDWSNRVSLVRDRDEVGIPLTRLDWRVGDFERTSVLSWLNALDAALRSADIGHVVMPNAGWETDITGGPHHMGTTRMSDDPRHGVVDVQCRVHSLDNLYVAGSSVFSTGGYTNPTFSLIALALRLADHLGRTLGH